MSTIGDWGSARDRAELDAHLTDIPDIDDERGEEDAVISSSGPLGSRTSASFGSDFLGEFSEETEALDAIADAMRASKFYPNVWRISDHGNEILLDDFYNGRELI